MSLGGADDGILRDEKYENLGIFVHIVFVFANVQVSAIYTPE